MDSFYSLFTLKGFEKCAKMHRAPPYRRVKRPNLQGTILSCYDIATSALAFPYHTLHSTSWWINLERRRTHATSELLFSLSITIELFTICYRKLWKLSGKNGRVAIVIRKKNNVSAVACTFLNLHVWRFYWLIGGVQQYGRHRNAFRNITDPMTSQAPAGMDVVFQGRRGKSILFIYLFLRTAVKA